MTHDEENDPMEEAALQEDRLMEFECIQDLAQTLYMTSLEEEEEEPTPYRLELLTEAAFRAAETFYTIANQKRRRYTEYGRED